MHDLHGGNEHALATPAVLITVRPEKILCWPAGAHPFLIRSQNINWSATLMGDNLESSCTLLFTSRGNRGHPVHFSIFPRDCPRCQLSQRAIVQRPTEKSVGRSTSSPRCWGKTIRDELCRLPRPEWPGHRQHSRSFQGTHAIRTRW